MTEPLTLDRFRALAEAYGGVIAHWPEPVREAAQAMSRSPEAGAILQEALQLDEALDAWRVPAASRQLHERIAGTAPRARQQAKPGIVTRTRLWWSGIGLAAALAGAVTGGIVVTMAAPWATPGDHPSENSTSFGDIGGQEN
jgi:hypothetical protein